MQPHDAAGRDAEQFATPLVPAYFEGHTDWWRIGWETLRGIKRTSLNVIAGGAFWLLLCCAGWLWFDSAQSDIQRGFEQNAIPEPPVATRARANLMAFNRRAPRRDFIADVSIIGRSQPSALRLQLKPAWNREPVATQKRVMNAWVSLWVELVKANPANGSKPQMQVYRADGAKVG